MASSVLATDGYKFSMAEAGWPLRRETFYYSHRRGGRQVLPLDVAQWLKTLWPEVTPLEVRFLAENDYEPGAGTWAALKLTDEVTVSSLPKGSVFLAGEPVFSITGPSALVSWLEPLLLQLHFRIQAASLALSDREVLARSVAVATCEREKELVLETLDMVGQRAVPIRVDSDAYRDRVREAAAGLVRVVEDPDRLFEVGLRAASSIEQHLIALEGCRAAGIRRTSHVLGALRLGMIPVGTMGHEHVQRYGSDLAAFRAMRERRPQRSSYLLDTFDTLRSGLPTAMRLIEAEPNRGDSIRFDSGDKEAQYRVATAQAQRLGVRPVQILEDALDEAMTVRFEKLREELGWAPTEQFYGYGGYLVARTAFSPFTRDRVAAIYKLSQTGPDATMKFGDEAAHGKWSIPGRPVVWRRAKGEGPTSLIAQEGEPVQEGYFLYTGTPDPLPAPEDLEPTVGHSPATRALVEALDRKRQEAFVA
jgi:nicotinic acid phosphoribosyltransferase